MKYNFTLQPRQRRVLVLQHIFQTLKTNQEDQSGCSEPSKTEPDSGSLKRQSSSNTNSTNSNLSSLMSYESFCISNKVSTPCPLLINWLKYQSQACGLSKPPPRPEPLHLQTTPFLLDLRAAH